MTQFVTQWLMSYSFRDSMTYVVLISWLNDSYISCEHINDFCQAHRFITSRMWMSHVTHTWVSPITHMNESSHAHECVHTHTRTHTHTHTHTWMSQVIHMHASCHTHQMNHVTHVDEKGHTSEWFVSRKVFTLRERVERSKSERETAHTPTRERETYACIESIERDV